MWVVTALQWKSVCSEHFTDAKLESWDRIRISCTQPFRKDQFGLRFLRITAEGDEIAENTQVVRWYKQLK